MAGPRIGILGGTFDPPHHGHLIVASETLEALQLDRILLVPAAHPPHKRGAVRATGEQRLRMLKAAVAGDSRFDLDDLELRRAGPSYTVDTLRVLREREPGATFYFLLGADQYRELDSWRDPEEVVRLASLAVFARGGETPDLSGPYGGTQVPVNRIDISATDIRRRCSLGLSIRYLVPEVVRRIIQDERIYENSEL